MPCHHTLEGYLTEYIERARLADTGRAPLFRAIKHRPYGRGQAGQTASTPGRWCGGGRAPQVLPPCNHTFRGTGITAHLENGGTHSGVSQNACLIRAASPLDAPPGVAKADISTAQA